MVLVIVEYLLDYEFFVKFMFSVMGNMVILQVIVLIGCIDWFVCGIEVYICVYQIVCDLFDNGYYVYIVNDVVLFRNFQNKVLVLDKM